MFHFFIILIRLLKRGRTMIPVKWLRMLLKLIQLLRVNNISIIHKIAQTLK